MENKIEFNLELYNSGEYDVVTRNNRSVKIAGVNEEANKFHQVTGWIDNEVSRTWSLNGITNDWSDGSPSDLFLIPKKKIIKGWANVYVERGRYELSIVRETKEEAINIQAKGAIGLVYIETELITNK